MPFPSFISFLFLTVACYLTKTVLHVEKKMKGLWRDFHLPLSISVKMFELLIASVAPPA